MKKKTRKNCGIEMGLIHNSDRLRCPKKLRRTLLNAVVFLFCPFSILYLLWWLCWSLLIAIIIFCFHFVVLYHCDCFLVLSISCSLLTGMVLHSLWCFSCSVHQLFCTHCDGSVVLYSLWCFSCSVLQLVWPTAMVFLFCPSSVVLYLLRWLRCSLLTAMVFLFCPSVVLYLLRWLRCSCPVAEEIKISKLDLDSLPFDPVEFVRAPEPGRIYSGVVRRPELAAQIRSETSG